MFNILVRELKRNKRSTIIWIICIILLNILTMSIYPSFSENTKASNEMMNAMPKELLQAFGLDKINMTDLLGYYATQAYFYVILFGSIYAAILASSILAKEEAEKTIEFLLAKPITRNSVISGKFLALLIFIIIFNLLITIATYITFLAVETQEFDMNRFLLLAVGAFLVQLTFASISFFLSVFITKSKTAYPISIGLVIIGYIFNIISNISDKMENLKYLSPFKYVDYVDILVNGKIENLYLIIFLILNLLLIAGTYIFYNRKNLNI